MWMNFTLLLSISLAVPQREILITTSLTDIESGIFNVHYSLPRSEHFTSVLPKPGT